MRPYSRHPLGRLDAKSRLRILGINSGTSIDALDLALTEIRDQGSRRDIRVLDTRSFAIPRSLRTTLRGLASEPVVDKETVARAHFEFGRFIGASALRVARRMGKIDLVASHGQTIGHYSGSDRHGGKLLYATWQIGSVAAIAGASGIPTAGDFRSADVAAGGMGAPLSGYYHYLLFGKNHVVLNLGGIANLSAARTRNRKLEVLAFDAGPGNMILDHLAQSILDRPFDSGGKVAATGLVDWALVRRVLRGRYFRTPPPKTCGREEFGVHKAGRWFRSPGRGTGCAPDLLATAAAITVTAVTTAVRSWIEPFTPVRSLIVSGGGAKNLTVVRMLKRGLADWRVRSSREFGLHPQFVEPVGFAVLGYETARNRPGNLGGATGGAEAVLGTIALP